MWEQRGSGESLVQGFHHVCATDLWQPREAYKSFSESCLKCIRHNTQEKETNYIEILLSKYCKNVHL